MVIVDFFAVRVLLVVRHQRMDCVGTDLLTAVVDVKVTVCAPVDMVARIVTASKPLPTPSAPPPGIALKTVNTNDAFVGIDSDTLSSTKVFPPAFDAGEKRM